MTKELNIDEYYSQINARIKKIKIPGMTREDVQQECMIAVLQYVDAAENPTKGGINNSINRTLYHLIKNNVTFEGCNAANKTMRRSISNPMSGTLMNTCAEEETNVFLDHKDQKIDQSEAMIAEDMILKFKSRLTVTELKIYELMILGNSKPKQICECMYGVALLNNTKTVSNHMVKIRNKFLQFYHKETGVWLATKK